VNQPLHEFVRHRLGEESSVLHLLVFEPFASSRNVKKPRQTMFVSQGRVDLGQACLRYTSLPIR
jgi:hypothetical protein